jgi:hypothetical protein
MRDFLPYKGYNLLDTQWIVGGTSSPAVTRLRGLDEQEYELELRASPLATPLDQRACRCASYFATSTPPATPARPKVAAPPSRRRMLQRATRQSMDIAREIFQLEREKTDLELVATKGRAQVEVGRRIPTT